jgi:hypothetical protein
LRGTWRVASLAACVLLIGCAPRTAVEQTFEQPDLAGRSTYAYAGGDPVPGTQLPDPAVEAIVGETVRHELATRGYREVERERADFLVAFASVMRRKVGQSPVPSVSPTHDWTSSGTSRAYYGGADDAAIELVLLTPDGEVLWRRAAVASISPEESGAERASRIRAAVREILKVLPANPRSAPPSGMPTAPPADD